MADRPILFSGPMVRAILDGRKTQTRRVVKDQPEFGEKYAAHDPWFGEDGLWRWMHGVVCRERTAVRCRYGVVGDRLWVRETFQYESKTGDFEWDVKNCLIRYRATEPDAGPWVNAEDVESSAWRPSIHMPRWASRLTLEVTGVRVERVQDISAKDAVSEACLPGRAGMRTIALNGVTAFDAFRQTWDSLNAKRGYSWDANPWVWVLEFKRILSETETPQ